MKFSSSKPGIRLIQIGIAILALAWICAVGSSKLAEMSLFRSQGDEGGFVNFTSILVVSGFALAHFISIVLLLIGLISYFTQGFSLSDKGSLIWGACGLVVVAGGSVYLYGFIFGFPHF